MNFPCGLTKISDSGLTVSGRIYFKIALTSGVRGKFRFFCVFSPSLSTKPSLETTEPLRRRCYFIIATLS